MANLARMRAEVPPPGRALSFPEWAEAIVAGVRRYLPDAKAVRKGARLVIVRHGELEARLVDDGGAFCISFRAGDSATTMSGLVDRDRRDAYTTSTMAHSVLMRAHDPMSLFHRNAFLYKGSALQVEQGKGAVSDGSFRGRKTSGAESHSRRTCVINPLLTHAEGVRRPRRSRARWDATCAYAERAPLRRYDEAECGQFLNWLKRRRCVS
jgi:hypothetical protein